MIVKLKKPKFSKTSGQGENPKGLTLSGNVFEWGAICKVSSRTDKDGNPESKPYPLIPKGFYEEHKSQFTIIEKGK